MNQQLPGGTILLGNAPHLLGGGAVGGKKEAEGPLGDWFDYFCEDGRFDQATWEKAESEMQREALHFALDRAGKQLSDIDVLFSGDLLNQCTASAFAHRASGTSYLGLYSACATFAEGLALAALLISSGAASCAASCVSSHFCSAERQYRYPLNYGGQRTPTAQWTVTGAGCTILAANGAGPAVRAVTPGRIVDMGIRDANNMGAAMAPAAYDTISRMLRDTNTRPEDYDLIVTGDLGICGKRLLCDLFHKEEGLDLSEKLMDCGDEIFAIAAQDMHSGGSGAGCSAVVFSRYVLDEMKKGRWRKVLFAGTGALLSPLSSQQGESIPSICHAVSIE